MYTQGQAIDCLDKYWWPVKLSSTGLNNNVLYPICHGLTGEAEKNEFYAPEVYQTVKKPHLSTKG